MFIISYTKNLPEDDLVMKTIRWIRNHPASWFLNNSVEPTITALAVRHAQDFMTTLRANPNAIGIFDCSDGFSCQSLTLHVRQAGATNLLFALVPDRDYRRSISEILAAGADQGQVHTITPGELGAYLVAMVQRVQRRRSSSVQVGPIRIDFDGQFVLVHGQRLNLTDREYQFVAILAKRHGSIVSKTTLLSQIYQGLDEPASKIIDVFACKVRAKLREYGCASCIETAWGQGYTLHDNSIEGRP